MESGGTAGEQGYGGELAGRAGADEDFVAPQFEIPFLGEVLASAARLQEIVPDAVLVGGTAAAVHAHHRHSVDHDHVVTDLRDRFEAVLDALEADPAFVLNRITPGKIILGQLDGIEVGVRQLIRSRPLEVEDFDLPDGTKVRVPTLDESLRIKAYMIVKRNHVRDYLDVAALSAITGTKHAARVLARSDEFYTDPEKGDGSFPGQLVHQLGNPRPRDTTQLDRLAEYKGLVRRWQDWNAVVAQLQTVAAYMMDGSNSEMEGEPHNV